MNLSRLGRQPFSEVDLARAHGNGLKVSDLPSLGSGLARVGENEFVGISDRGPNGTVELRGAEQRTFPLPGFCPFIVRFKLAEGKIQIQNTILLADGRGKPLTGLSNGKGEGRLFESGEAKPPLPFDPNGVDPEAIGVFPGGKFLMSVVNILCQRADAIEIMISTYDPDPDSLRADDRGERSLPTSREHGLTASGAVVHEMSITRTVHHTRIAAPQFS